MPGMVLEWLCRLSLNPFLGHFDTLQDPGYTDPEKGQAPRDPEIGSILTKEVFVLVWMRRLSWRCFYLSLNVQKGKVKGQYCAIL